MVIFQVNLGQPVPPRIYSSTCSRTESFVTSGAGILRTACPSCHSTSTEGNTKNWLQPVVVTFCVRRSRGKINTIIKTTSVGEWQTWALHGMALHGGCGRQAGQCGLDWGLCRLGAFYQCGLDWGRSGVYWSRPSVCLSVPRHISTLLLIQQPRNNEKKRFKFWQGVH